MRCEGGHLRTYEEEEEKGRRGKRVVLFREQAEGGNGVA